MRKLFSALAIGLASLLVIGGDAVLTGGASANTVSVPQAIPLTVAAAPSLLTDPILSPDAARLSAMAGAAVLATQENAETAEDAAVNNGDLSAKSASKTAETEAKTEEKAGTKAETEKKDEAKEETPVSETIQALGVVSGTGVRMRSGAGTGNDILKTLDKGTVVELTAVEGDWYRVSYEGQRGYVIAQYVTRYDSASGLNGAGKVTADILNIRAAAKSGSSSLATVSNGTVIAVTGIEPGGWFAVTYNGVSGYVASQYVLICSPAKISAADKSAETPAETPAKTPAETPVETPAETPAASASGSDVVSIAQQYLGTPYVYGGAAPGGFDCSGFTTYVFSQVGVSLPHGATSQLSRGTEVSRSDLQPGDLVFFQDYGAVASHVGIYIGGDQFIHASSSYYNGHCVVISSLTETYYNNHYLTARRH